MFFNPLPVSEVLILPSLVRMEYKPVEFIVFLKRLIKHIIYLLEVWRFGYIIGYDFTIEHIKNR